MAVHWKRINESITKLQKIQVIRNHVCLEYIKFVVISMKYEQNSTNISLRDCKSPETTEYKFATKNPILK